MKLLRSIPVALSLLVLPAFGQTAIRPSLPNEEIVELSPFEVNAAQDRGYAATTQISATRLNVPIKELPFFVSVITPELMADIATDDLNSALRYLPSVTPRVQAGFYDTAYTMRGQEVNFVFRDGMRLFRAPAIEHVERVEVLKGPAAVLYGESAPGGGINFITKKATWRPMAEVNGSVDSNGMFRSRFDLNQVAKPNELAFRVVGSYATGQTHTDFQENVRWTINPSLVWRPAPRTRVEVSFEHLDEDRANQLGNGLFAWYGPNGAGGRSPDGQTGRPVGIHPGQGVSTNVFPNGYFVEQNDAFLAQIEQQFGDDTYLRLAYGQTVGIGDWGVAVVNDRLAFGPTSPSFSPDILNLVVPRRQMAQNSERVYRAEMVTSFEGLAGKHTLIGGAELIYAGFKQQTMVNPNEIRDDANPLFIAFNARTGEYFGMARPGVLSLRERAVQTSTWQRDERLGYYANYQGQLLDGKVRLLAGIRQHDFERTNLLNPTAAPGTNDDLTPQYGISFTPVAAITLFASYSESYRPQLGRDALGNDLPPLQGEGYDFGLKADLMGGKVVGTVSYFSTDLTGLLRSDPTFISIGFGNTFASGVENSSGLDVDLLFTPKPNWQAMLGLTFLETEVVSNTQQPQLKGLPTVNAADFYATFWTKYSFGPEVGKGLWVGGGASHTGGGRIPRYSWAFTLDSYTLFDAAVGWDGKMGGHDWSLQLNVKNLTDERYFYNDSFPGRPLEFVLSAGMKF